MSLIHISVSFTNTGHTVSLTMEYTDSAPVKPLCVWIIMPLQRTNKDSVLRSQKRVRFTCPYLLPLECPSVKMAPVLGGHTAQNSGHTSGAILHIHQTSPNFPLAVSLPGSRFCCRNDSCQTLVCSSSPEKMILILRQCFRHFFQ